MKLSEWRDEKEAKGLDVSQIVLSPDLYNCVVCECNSLGGVTIRRFAENLTVKI